MKEPHQSRRRFLQTAAAAAGSLPCVVAAAAADDKADPPKPKRKAQIAITYDLEMSRHYPRREMMEWDYQKGNLDGPTKAYSLESARIAKSLGGVIHYFCVGRVLEQKNVDWLKEIAKLGHPIGNHTYDHVNVLARTVASAQFRFQRAPWLVRGKSAAEVIRRNIEITTTAMKQRAGVVANGFRTPGGFHSGLAGREDLQKMMLELGFTWISSKYPRHQSGKPKQEPPPEVYKDIVDSQERAQPFVYPSGLIEIPMSPISDVTAFRSHFWKREYFLKAIRMCVEWAIETGGVYDFLCHPSCMVVEDPKFETVRMICETVNKASDRAEVVGLDAIARRVTEEKKNSG